MKKLVTLSSKEALLLLTSLSHTSKALSSQLHNSNVVLASDAVTYLLDALDHCDDLRSRISKTFPDLSNID